MESIVDQYRRAPGLGKGHAERILKYGLSLNIELADLIQGTELPLAFLAEPFDISTSDELTIISNVVKRTSYPFAEGFKLGMTYRVSDLGLFGMAIMSSKNGAHAAQIVSRYLSHAYSFIGVKLEVDRSKIKIIFELLVDLEEGLAQFIMARDFGIAYSVQKYFLDRDKNNAYELGFNFPYLNGMDLMAETFGCPVKHNRGHCYLLADIHQLSVEPPFSNEINAKMLEENYQKSLQADISETPNLTDRISDYLVQHSMDVHKKEVASEFHMSERTLTRHLEKEGITWRELMRRVRLEKAEMMLQMHSKPLQKIADEVGFSSLSSFSHAFAKHKGISPSEYRKLIEAMESAQHDPA